MSFSGVLCFEIVKLLHQCFGIIRRVVLHNLDRVATVDGIDEGLQFRVIFGLQFLYLLKATALNKGLSRLGIVR